MSLSEQAADRLRQCIFGLTPTLLAALTDLRQAQPQQLLLPFSQVREALTLFIDKPSVKEAFGIVENLSSAEKDGTEVRIRNLCLEISNNELRKVVLEDTTGLSASSETSDAAFASTFNRLDVVLALSLQDLIDPTLPLSLVEELIESQPISTCLRLFGYTESRVKPLTIDLHPTRGKGLVLLRTCNELLRRLSKPSQQHTVFAGRILSLLAKVFPLGERSGVNLRGDFNVENKTIIEEKQDEAAEDSNDVADKDEKDQIFKVDYEFYELFWKVQRFFSNPPLLMAGQDSSRPSTRNGTPAPLADAGEGENDDPAPEGAKGAMAELRISTRKILKLFGAVTKREKELAGAASAEEAKVSANKSGSSTPQPGVASNKRQSDNDNGNSSTGFFVGQSIGKGSDQPPRKRLRPDVVDGVKSGGADIDEAMVDEGDEAVAESGHFFPTYLTGRKLFEYEIRDTSFRKHILVQYFVLFQYLLSFTPAAKESWKDWKNKTLQALFTLEEADERWIRATWREIQALIREIQPDGRLFLESVLEVLKREANWIRWKTESCPSIEKPPLTPEQISTFASARALLLRKAEPYPHKLGTAALSELWADGLRPPVPGTRRVENEMGEYVTVTTDGLEELEFLPPIPSLEHYNKSIQREKMKLDMRKKQLGIDPATNEAQLSKEEKDKLDGDDRIQAKIETMQSLAWKALRVASRDNLHLFGKPDRPENIEGLLKAMEEERNPKPKPVPPVKAFTAEAQAAEDTVKATEESSKSKEEEGAAKVSAQADGAEAATGPSTDAAEPVKEDEGEGAAEPASTASTVRSTEEAAKDESIVPVVIPAVPGTRQETQEAPDAKVKKDEETVSPRDVASQSTEGAVPPKGEDVNAKVGETPAKDKDVSPQDVSVGAPTPRAGEPSQDVEMSEATL